MSQESRAITLARLDEQIQWHERSAGRNQRLHRWSSVAQIVLSASIILASSIAAQSGTPTLLSLNPALLSALIAGCLTVLKGIESTFDWQTNWVNYRAVAEALKQEKYLHAAGAGTYHDVDDADRLLAERVEELISKENAQWVSSVTRRSEKVDEGAKPVGVRTADAKP